MGPLKLRRLAESDLQRLGSLLARVKESVSSDSEDAELLSLLKKAQRISDTNAQMIADLRRAKLPPKPPIKSYAKSS